MNTLKSIGAILAGLIVTVILSVLTDMLLESGGLMKKPFDANPVGFILFVILYRCLYNILGCYIAAALAPQYPMKHAIILGCIGFALSIAGTILMAGQGPSWYGIALVLTALPCAWIGGKLRKERRQSG